MLPYTINEEIIRQTLEVKFRINSKTYNDWYICFSNPTAGPWKNILFVTQKGEIIKIGSYEKEEKRPDLIIFSRNNKSVLIIEAKEKIEDLIKEKDKIIKTFDKEEKKLKSLPLIQGEINDFEILYGLVFYSLNPIVDYPKVKNVYNLNNLVVFFVMLDGVNLVIKGETEIESKTINELKKFIPF